MGSSTDARVVRFDDHLAVFKSPEFSLVCERADNWLTASRVYRIYFGETLGVQLSKLVGVKRKIGPWRSNLDSNALFGLHFDVDGLQGRPVGDWFLVEVLLHLESQSLTNKTRVGRVEGDTFLSLVKAEPGGQVRFGSLDVVDEVSVSLRVKGAVWLHHEFEVVVESLGDLKHCSSWQELLRRR